MVFKIPNPTGGQKPWYLALLHTISISVKPYFSTMVLHTNHSAHPLRRVLEVHTHAHHTHTYRYIRVQELPLICADCSSLFFASFTVNIHSFHCQIHPRGRFDAPSIFKSTFIMNREEEHALLCRIAGLVILGLAECHELGISFIDKQPCHTRPFSGEAYIQDLLKGHPGRFRENFRMQIPTFLRLCDNLQSVGLNHSRWVSLEQQLGIFLFIVANKNGNRMAQEMFQHSGETIHRLVSLPFSV